MNLTMICIYGAIILIGAIIYFSMDSDENRWIVLIGVLVMLFFAWVWYLNKRGGELRFQATPAPVLPTSTLNLTLTSPTDTPSVQPSFPQVKVVENESFNFDISPMPSIFMPNCGNSNTYSQQKTIEREFERVISIEGDGGLEIDIELIKAEIRNFYGLSDGEKVKISQELSFTAKPNTNTEYPITFRRYLYKGTVEVLLDPNGNVKTFLYELDDYVLIPSNPIVIPCDNPYP